MPGTTTTTTTSSAGGREPGGEPGRRAPDHHRLLPLVRVLAFVARWLLPELFPDLVPGLLRWFDELRSFPSR